jgi:hypothetical protein
MLTWRDEPMAIRDLPSHGCAAEMGFLKTNAQPAVIKPVLFLFLFHSLLVSLFSGTDPWRIRA